ncbi:MAG TPA: class I SAM-dependent RNA methyltransferase [Anaeromyxobacteraceae bacterium]|nr:class I SAM-dependent RNA methyltransferase [Anaeromyxobacteraceae bacterium]
MTDPVEVEIDGLAPGGEGAGRWLDRPVFVPFAAPGDRVRLELPPGDGPAHAPPLAVLRPGPGRVDPPCPHFGPGEGEDRACGGCEWMHLRYDLQLAEKERGLQEAFRRIGRMDPGGLPFRPILPSPRALRYRFRAKFHLDRGGAGLCFFRRRSHEPVRLRECHLLEPGLESLRSALGPALLRHRLRPAEVALEWSQAQGRGAALLRGVDAGEGTRRRAEELLGELDVLAGLLLEEPGAGRGGRAPVAVGDPVLRHERVAGRPEAGLARSRPDVFQQANRAANERLVDAALAFLEPDGEEVLELFCGAGNFTGPLARRAARVAAVEGQGPAIELARADLAGGNVRFYAGEALAMASALAREGRRFGAVLLDPPRDGMRGVGPLLRDLGAPRVVYVSCDPATLARDVRAAVAAGYQVSAVQPVDMFPQTHHVEAVVRLDRA